MKDNIENTCIRSRIEKLRELMQNRGIDVYIICTDDFHGSEYVGDYFKAREYMSGFTGSAGILVVAKDEAFLWTDGRYFIQAETQLQGSGIGLMKMGQENVPSIQGYISSCIQDNGVIGFDGRTVSNDFADIIKKSMADKKIIFKGNEDLVNFIWTDRPELSKEKVWVLEEKYAGLKSSEKLNNIRKCMRDKEADIFVLTSLDDIAWLLNLRGNDVKCNPVFLSYLIIYMDKGILYLNEEILNNDIKTALSENGIEIKPYNDIYRDLVGIKTGKRLMLDYKRVNYRICESLPKDIKVINCENPTIYMKAVKNKVETDNMRKAHIKDGVAVTRFMYWLKENVGKTHITEVSVAYKLEKLRGEQEGYIGPSFEPIMAYGVHGAIIHYSATDKTNAVIKEKGLLLSDTGGHYYEGTTDITRTFVMGELSEEEKKAYTLVLKGHLRLSAAKFLYGVRGINLDILARQSLWEHGMDYRHGTGHGVGYILNVHEAPNNIRWKTGDYNTDSAVLEEGMITSNEPGVYVENEFGVRLENLILCKKSEKNVYGQFMEFENLTLVPFEKSAIDKRYMSDKDIELLNKYHEKVYEVISPYLPDNEAEWLRDVTSPLN